MELGRTDKIYGLSLVYAPLSSFSDRTPISNYAIRCRFASKSTHYRLFCLFCSASQYSIACCFSHIFHPTFIDFQTIINYIQTYYYIMKYCLHRDKLMSATANLTILTSKILYCHACRTDLERRAGRISAKHGRRSRVRRLRTKQKQGAPTSRVLIKQYLQKFPKWGRFGVTSVTPFLLLPVHPEGCTPAHRT